MVAVKPAEIKSRRLHGCLAAADTSRHVRSCLRSVMPAGVREAMRSRPLGRSESAVVLVVTVSRLLDP